MKTGLYCIKYTERVINYCKSSLSISYKCGGCITKPYIPSSIKLKGEKSINGYKLCMMKYLQDQWAGTQITEST